MIDAKDNFPPLACLKEATPKYSLLEQMVNATKKVLERLIPKKPHTKLEK